MLPSPVDVATMANSVNDNRLLLPQDLKDDAVRSFSDLVESAQLPFQRIELCGIEVGGEPMNSVCNPLSSGLIELLKLFRGRFKNAD